MKLTEEELAGKAFQLLQSGLWKQFIEVVIEDEIKKLDDSWGNKEIEDIKEMQIKKRMLIWLKNIPRRFIEEEKRGKK